MLSDGSPVLRRDHRLERAPRVGGVALEGAIAAGRTSGAERRGQGEGEGESRREDEDASHGALLSIRVT